MDVPIDFIHDSVWGTNRYEAFEVALINTPIIQRLRQIHQTAYTQLTYPSASHSRFEHTLGVTTQVGKLFAALENKFSDFSDKKDLLGDDFKRSLRIAALMHDVGHGPSSHTSEEIYKYYPEIKLLKKYPPFKSANPHEIFAYLILSSDHFTDFFKKLKSSNPCSIEIDLAKNAIVGYSLDETNQYKIDILNGPFDADKLDYLFRDGHFSGLPLSIDLDRLWYALDINFADGRRRLTVDWGGASSLEQIVFSKMMLFPAVYHHHKVRTCDCMFKGIIEYIVNKSFSMKDLIPGAPDESAFKRATHFLYLTDDDILGLLDKIKGDRRLHDLVHNLKYRRLLKRAMVISRDTVEDPSKIDDYVKFIESKPNFYRDLAKKIAERANLENKIEEIWVDCPKDPKFSSVNDTWISPLGEGQEAIRFSEFFKAQQYADQYKYHKWRSHIFCCAEDVQIIKKAATEVLKQELDLKFNPLAYQLCHLTPP